MAADTEPVLTPGRVEGLFNRSVAAEGEPGIAVSGVISRATFAPDTIEAARDEIRAMLAELPDQFRKSGEGGWSFLNACQDRHGSQGTGLHADMEILFMLGIAAGLVTEVLPRDLWSALPGGMPYYAVDL
jgi:hypothetical protein